MKRLIIKISEEDRNAMLEINAKEVLMCRFLADLLNPEGQHGCGTLFLKSFLEDVLNRDDVNETLLEYTHVLKEYVMDHDRRIDIMIQNSRFNIPMEVKIFADEQEGQCYDYYGYAKNSPLVYLTRFGDSPSSYSRKKQGSTDILPLNHIRCISWEDDICCWLTKLLEKLDKPMKSIVMQYIDTIHVFTDEGDKRFMERSLEVLYESPDYFGAGIEIERSMKTAKLGLMRLVFDDFKEEMEIIAPQYGLELEKEAVYYSYEEKQHDKFYDTYSTYPGLNYVVKKAKFKEGSLQMWFRIEVLHNLYAGITLFDTKLLSPDGKQKGYQVYNITENLIDEATQYLDRDVMTPSDWWFTWCYPNGKHQDDYYDDVPDFRNMNQCAINLVDRQYRKKFVRDAVKVFEEHILKYLR